VTKRWTIVLVTLAVCLSSTSGRAEEATTKPAAGAKLKVGVLVSQYTATGPNLGGRPYGYAHANVAGELKDDSLQLIPIIEPDSENDADLAAVVKEKFPDAEGQVYRADDKTSLATLDAIVLARVPNLKDEVIEGVKHAVDGGVGLLVVGRVGNVTPGYTNKGVCELVGMTEAVYAWNLKPQPCEILAADDPLIKSVPPTDTWEATPAGAMGKLKEGSKPLIKLSATDELKFPADKEKTAAEGDYNVLYVTSLGKGPVLVCAWSTLPTPLRHLDGQSFYVRGLHRLAEMKKK
jgi:hypothetical protein